MQNKVGGRGAFLIVKCQVNSGYVRYINDNNNNI